MIIYVLGDYSPQSANGIAEFSYLTAHMLKDDFDFHFIEFKYNQEINQFQHKIVDGFNIHSFESSKKSSRFSLNPLFENWLKNIKTKDCIFHLHHIYNFRNYLVSKLLVKNDFSYIITPHDSFVYSQHFQKSQSLFKRIRRKLMNILFDKYVLDNANVIHAITDYCVPSLKELTNNKVSVVYNQVKDLDIPFNIDKIKPYVCFIGRFNIYTKGIDLALKAFSLFKKNEQNKNIVFNLIGPYDQRSYKTCGVICDKLNLNIGQEINITGKITEEERNNYLAISKVYMQLSRTEGFGLSVVQALSSYKPVIISDQIPIHRQILKHNAGYVVENTEQASDCLNKIFNLTENEYIAMAKNARNCFMEEFHPKIIKPQFIELYKENSK